MTFPFPFPRRKHPARTAELLSAPARKRTAPLRILRFLALFALVFSAVMMSCQSRLIYFPRSYPPREPQNFATRGGERLDFATTEGRQAAWLIPPRSETSTPRLWIVCGGNAALALDMEPICRAVLPPEDGILLIDYPGYGACEGSPRPSRIRDSLRAVIPLAAARLSIPESEFPARLCGLGHSLGCSAVLMAAEEFPLRRAILCAPFTSTMEMARVMFRLPLGFLVWHRFDNRKGLAALEKSGGHAWIFHGGDDDIVPPAMSTTLADEFPRTITHVQISGAGHNDILDAARTHIRAAVADVSNLHLPP